MKLIHDVTPVRHWRAGVAGSVGFVPTMGSLHEGHLALVRAARETCEHVVVSIYVNPLQFGPGEDFDAYPRTLDADLQQLQSLEIDAVFAPASLERAGTTTQIQNPALGSGWCGQGRPGHFDGVLGVVSKLFNLVQPTDCWFGQKDFQQARIIEAWIDELYVPTSMHIHPIVRDGDGLALSSRNQYLSPEERIKALGLSRALNALQRSFEGGQTRVGLLLKEAQKQLKGLEIEYFGVADPRSLEPVDMAQPGCVALVAARCGSTRLIDNHRLLSVN